ncbi:MAG: TIGR02302 family protein [Rhodobacteraceae bacterium]|nr:TIGR02302 family protein [Paracoccaceae bacterium]
MTERRQIVETTLARLGWQLRLTRAGLAAERLARAFWPAWTVLLAGFAAAAFGLHEAGPPGGAAAGLAGLGVLLLVLVALGLRRLRWPTAAEARERLDRGLAGRPLAALLDSQAVGGSDPGSAAVWDVHVTRMAARAASARAPAPDLRLASRDRFALRYVALTAAAAAVIFGSFGRVATVADIGSGAAAAAAAGPSWEGWIQPPAYTGRPTLYLAEIVDPQLSLPAGSRVALRFYGEAGALTLDETVSAPREASAAGPAGPAGPAAADLAVAEFEVARSGKIEIAGPGGRRWEVTLLPDAAPAIAFDGPMTRERGGQLRQGFRASDDYGVVTGRAEIALDLAAVDRRHGLAPDPEPRETIVLDLPLPMTASRTEVTDAIVDNLSQHPWANLPVRVTLHAADARGQEGHAEAAATVLPGRRFFDPLAAAVIEMRRDLLWSRAGAARAAQVLRAVSHRPEGFVRNERAYLLLRVAIRRLEGGTAAEGGLGTELRDEIAAALWEIATLIEAGDLADALERMQRAQDRLSEAMRNGADPAEIDELMQEFREALDQYMRQLAEQQADRPPDSEMAEQGERMEMTGRQLQEMLDRLQELMEQGRMEEAAELMEMLRQLMENMQVTQGPGGEGSEGGEGTMRDLADTLRRQQGLSDDTFREFQERFGPGQPGQPGQGERQGGGEGEGGTEGGLAERQRELRDELRGLAEGPVPGEGSEAGDRAREALDRAGRAMREAEEALREGDNAGALDRQAEAMEAMREGMREMGEAMAEAREGERGDSEGREDPRGTRDPLGRETGSTGRIGTDRDLLQGDDVYRRAQELLDELRRRSGEQDRPSLELDYLRRLLERF